MGGFSVVLGDLTNMASSFASANRQYTALRPEITPVQPETGEASLDEQLTSLLALLDVLHTKMSEAIDEHSKRLIMTRDSFQRHDIDVRFMFDDMMPDKP
jgi:hypothetical protein